MTIETRKQWEITNEQIKRFRLAIEMNAQAPMPADVAPEFRTIQGDAMRSVIEDLERERLEFETTTKRFFRCDDDEATYVFVAFDLDDAKRMLRDSGIEFCNPNDSSPAVLGVPFDSAHWLKWRELDHAEAARRVVVKEDENKRMSLASCDIGDSFCSEWW